MIYISSTFSRLYKLINLLVLIWFEHILLQYNITNGSGTSSKNLDF
jgi:hypothetical protein